MKFARIGAAAIAVAAFTSPAMAQTVGNPDSYSNNWMNGSDAARGYANGNAAMGWDNSRASMERTIERPVRRRHRAHRG
jgi:hypothetical protein